MPDPFGDLSSNHITEGLTEMNVPIQPLLANLAINNLTIYKNHIFNCLQTTDDQELRAEMTRKGVGGISLGICEHLFIHRNRIENNGISYIYPVCGIYVAIGEQVDITHNYISNNGPLSGKISNQLIGIRGSIVLIAASSFDNSDSITGQDSFDFIGRHAARVHDNVVNQPAGQALRIKAFGPVSILNNQFNSELSGPELPHLLAGAVSIYNGGNFPATNSTMTNPITLPNGNVLFNSNQIFVGSANKSEFGIHIESEDDICFDSNQSDNFQTNNLIINTSLKGKTIRASNNRFKEIAEGTVSLKSVSDSLNNTTNNQGNHSINVSGSPTIDEFNQTLD